VEANEVRKRGNHSGAGAFDELGEESFAYLTTTGRRTGREHRIEIWFGLSGGVVYMLSGGGGRSDWVRNLRANPRVRIRIGGVELAARARVVEDPDEEVTARRLLAAKYQGWRQGAALSTWARTALVVAVEPEEER
jgi:deazaflavin-dependent oxidoreductase (nitroreductase family)